MRPRPLAAASISSQSYMISVMSWTGSAIGGGQVQEHRVAGLHVRGAAAEQVVAVAA